MFTPESRSKFRSNHRSYYRHGQNHPTWQAWADGDEAVALRHAVRRNRRLRILRGLIGALLIAAGVVAYFLLLQQPAPR